MRDRFFYPLVFGGLLTLFLIGNIGDKTEDANIKGYITNILHEYNEVLVVDKKNVPESGNPDATWVTVKDDTELVRKRWFLYQPIKFDKLEIGQEVAVVNSQRAYQLLPYPGRESADTFVVTKLSENSEDFSGEIIAITPLSETEFHFDEEGIYVTVGNENFVITPYTTITNKRGNALYYTDIKLGQQVKIWIAIPDYNDIPIIVSKVEVGK